MEWIKISDRLPSPENESDVYINCVCAIEDELVCPDAVFYRHDKLFFHNQDTNHSYPIPATHWMPPISPPKSGFIDPNQTEINFEDEGDV